MRITVEYLGLTIGAEHVAGGVRLFFDTATPEHCLGAQGVNCAAACERFAERLAKIKVLALLCAERLTPANPGPPDTER